MAPLTDAQCSPEHTFTLGQRLEGEGIVAEVVSLKPLAVMIVTVEGFWATYSDNADVTKPHARFTVGATYRMYLGNPQLRNFNFEHAYLPWISAYENGTLCHYR